jgi:hypothetical protein
MRPSVAFVAALTGLVAAACGGAIEDTTPGPAPAATAKGPDPAPGPPPAPPIPIPRAEVTPACFGSVLTWTGDGGWTSHHPTSTIKCRTYEHVYRRGQETLRCAGELETAGRFPFAELTGLLDDPVVRAVFARGGSIGDLRAGYDGVDDVIVFKGAEIVIGDHAPPALQHLVEVLHSIDGKECPLL